MWPNKLFLLFAVLTLSGCASFGFGSRDKTPPIETMCKPIERSPLSITDPAPLRLKAPKWIIVTPANANAIWKDLEEKKTDLALFALTDDGYEELSVDIAEIRNLINTQRIIIQKYKDYYEKPQTQEKPQVKDK